MVGCTGNGQLFYKSTSSAHCKIMTWWCTLDTDHRRCKIHLAAFSLILNQCLDNTRPGSQQIRVIHPMQDQCWSSVYKLAQHWPCYWVKDSCWLECWRAEVSDAELQYSYCERSLSRHRSIRKGQKNVRRKIKTYSMSTGVGQIDVMTHFLEKSIISLLRDIK